MLGFSRGWTRKVNLGHGLGSGRDSVAQVGIGGARRYSRCVSSGVYICCSEAQGFNGKGAPAGDRHGSAFRPALHLPCYFPWLPAELLLPPTHLSYMVSWSPREGSKGMERGLLSGVRRGGAVSLLQAADSPAHPKQRLKFILGVPGPSPTLFLPHKAIPIPSVQ